MNRKHRGWVRSGPRFMGGVRAPGPFSLAIPACAASLCRMPISEGQASASPVSSVRAGWGAANPHAEIIHRAAFRVFLATTLVAVGLAFAGVSAPSYGAWFYALQIVVVFLTALAALARRLPWQNVIACGLAVSLTVGMALAMAGSGSLGRMGLNAGGAATRSGCGIRDLGWSAWPAPLLWTAALLVARQTAKVLLQPWRRQRQYGWWLLGVATVLGWVAVAVSAPWAEHMLGWWSWADGGGVWAGMPAIWLGAVLAFVALLLLLASAWLIPKRPTGRAADFEPVWVWGGLVLWLACGDLRGGFWLPAALGFVAWAVVTALAWRAARMPITAGPGPGGST